MAVNAGIQTHDWYCAPAAEMLGVARCGQAGSPAAAGSLRDTTACPVQVKVAEPEACCATRVTSSCLLASGTAAGSGSSSA
jgi:hypothetical protein